jgi:hypothetical protein
MTSADIPGRAAYTWIYDDWIASEPARGAVVVEVGVALGRSIAYLCERLEAAGRDDIVVYGIDPWAGYARNGEQQELAEIAGGDFSLYAQMMLRHAPAAFERVRVLRMPSASAAQILPACIGLPDLVVIDAAHDYDSVHTDVLSWGKVLAAGGWIGGDDHHEDLHPGVVQALREIYGSGSDIGGYAYEVRRVHDWPTWLRRPEAR